MATFDYNPITGNLDLVGSGASYINGVVADPTALPVTVGTPPLDSVYLAKAGSGVWLINRRPSGLYCRVANNGNLNDWLALGAFPEVNSSTNWELYDGTDPTKELKFDLSGITTGTTRTLTVPNASGRIQVEGQPIGNTTPNSGAFTTLSANNGTLTASAPVLDLSQTWNNAAVTFKGMVFNVVNTASASTSNTLELQNNGTAVFFVRRTGSVVADSITCSSGGAFRFLANATTMFLQRDYAISWTNDPTAATSSVTNDLILRRDAAGVLGQRDLANPQAYRLYNTTDAGLTNFERGFMRWSSNVLQIGTEKLGTGSARALEFQTDGTSRLTLETAGTASFSSSILATNGFVRIASAQSFQWLNRSKIYSLADGNIGFYNAGETSFNLLQFGGTTSSFPALKRSSTTLQVRLADDSAFAPLEALSFTTANSRIVCDDANTVIHVGNTPRISLYGSNATYLGLGNAHDIRWSNTGRSDQATTFNISLARDADGILAQRAGTTAQTWRIYNTVSGTGNVNFERANFRWATNEFIIDAEAGGTGTSLRGIKIGSATSSLLGFYGVAPVDQPATVADPAGGGTVDTEARTAINTIIDRLQELGLIA